MWRSLFGPYKYSGLFVFVSCEYKKTSTHTHTKSKGHIYISGPCTHWPTYHDSGCSAVCVCVRACVCWGWRWTDRKMHCDTGHGSVSPHPRDCQTSRASPPRTPIPPYIHPQKSSSRGADTVKAIVVQSLPQKELPCHLYSTITCLGSSKKITCIIS